MRRIAVWPAVASLLSLVGGIDLNTLPQWTHMSPLLSAPTFTGRTLSEHRSSKVVPASDPIDLFRIAPSCTDGRDTCAIPSSIAYGSILMHLEECSTDAATNALAEAALALALPLDDLRLVSASALQLDATRDGINHHEVVSYVTPQTTSVYFRHQVNLGVNFYIEFQDTRDRSLHQVVVHLNTREHSFTLLQHTSSVAPDPGTKATKRGPRILSYNVWNVNPPAQIYGVHRRWGMYNKRLDHLGTFLADADADIIGFQEVRVDATFGPPGQHAQIQHLMARLDHTTYPQYVYRAAMSYLNDQDPLEHIEEGPAIVSKYPIVSTDYKLLSRQVNDPNDVHQRLCLHAVVDMPSWGLVDVYVTHLSLSERSREQTMLEIWDYMQAGQGVTQVLLGDLNAEPSSRGIQFLQGKAPLKGQTTDLRDAWLEVHGAEPSQPHDMTFPCDAPIKRIDFVLFRGKGEVDACDVIGQAPTPDTASNPKTVGMLESNSPIYASDHRGVLAQFSHRAD
ncbi:hypothetical protein SPRG_19251 [Saprolegnia parasitica CBS 223.65]|uniref:Endonuclease/exonuclease/phosphatase domain-containing protein n=1 Tax=Saprolegnia parasitica (strain CBS 223.65) TaxID=695850 RepID=A0A067CSE9_SAPPC|nr:hypothetical protein SPRG_19251 [Saprolegnia parasitica CBS 223.65]KDO33629.1 hypothetical protein SPRG_19251 [Saprolegnia parasitica CBS 223.65]|eukprot:XP_012195670.1 hypothetical protein SPRG_19251 [Saprolegnia parasitica CBS 223.65]